MGVTFFWVAPQLDTVSALLVTKCRQRSVCAGVHPGWRFAVPPPILFSFAGIHLKRPGDQVMSSGWHPTADPVVDCSGHALGDFQQREVTIFRTKSMSLASPNSPKSFSGSVTPSL